MFVIVLFLFVGKLIFNQGYIQFTEVVNDFY